jgi:hypothetical protein
MNELEFSAQQTAKERQDICERAFYIYINSPDGHGHDREHWFQAESERSLAIRSLGPKQSC